MKDINAAIDGFCGIILTENDFIDHSLADGYICELDDVICQLNEIEEPAKDKEIRAHILNNIIKYLRICKDKKEEGTLRVPPFSFDSGNNYKDYRDYFKKIYKEKYNNSKMPEVFSFTFDYIQEISEHYRIFIAFSETHDVETIEQILLKTTDFAKKMVEDVAESKVKAAIEKKVNDVVNEATKEAQISAKVAAQQAEKASLEAEKAAESAVENAVNNKMAEITQQISVTSVTILGIFSGIVLAVVGGLFYSSSVMENLYHTNVNKLICVAAIVGFIFFNLIVILFRYVDRVRNPKHIGNDNSAQMEKKKLFDRVKHYINNQKIDILILIVNVILIFILFFFYFKTNETNLAPQDKENTECAFVTEME